MCSPGCDARVVQVPQLGPLVPSGPTGRTRRGTRRCAPWRAPSPRRGARRRCSASKPNSSIASSSVTDWCALRLSSGARRRTRAALRSNPRRVRTISRSPSSAARAVAKRRSLRGSCGRCRCAAAGTGSCAGPERLFGAGAAARSNPCRRRTAAPGCAHSAGDLAQDVDRLGLQPVEMARRRSVRGSWRFELRARSCGGSRLRSMRPSSSTCRPHSLRLGVFPPPAAGADVLARLMARVHGAQPMRG